MLLAWKLDDEIENPQDCYVEVRFELDSGKRWMAFATPRFLERQLPNTGEPCWVQEHLAIALYISEDTIEQPLKFLLKEQMLIKHSLPLNEDD